MILRGYVSASIRGVSVSDTGTALFWSIRVS